MIINLHKWKFVCLCFYLPSIVCENWSNESLNQFESQCIRIFYTLMNFQKPKLVEHNTFKCINHILTGMRHLTLVDEMCVCNLCNMDECASEWMGDLDDKRCVAWIPACAFSRLLVFVTLRCVWSGLPLCTHNVTYPTIPRPYKTKLLLSISSCRLWGSHTTYTCGSRSVAKTNSRGSQHSFVDVNIDSSLQNK